MTTLQEALIASALDAASRGLISGTTNWSAFVATSIGAALEPVKGEPVAYVVALPDRPISMTVPVNKMDKLAEMHNAPLYTNPLRELSDEEIRACIHRQVSKIEEQQFVLFARAVLEKARNG